MPKIKTSPKRFAIYLRCSTDDQAEGDYTTIDSQREITGEHVASLGGTVVKTYADEGKTGKNLNRPVWKQMLSDAAEKKFDCVCVTYMSRLGRGDIFVIAKHELAKYGVTVELVKEKFGNDIAGRINEKATRFIDGAYVEMVREWTMTKMKQMVAHGFVTGATPYGYAKVFTSEPSLSPDDKKPPQKLVLDPVNAPVVSAAFELFAASGNYPKVRQFLTEHTGRNWSLQTTINLLENEAFLGVQKFGDWRNETAHEPIVSRELWQAVRERADASTKRFYGVHSDASEARRDGFYLRGLVRCETCGAAMTPGTHKGRNSYVSYYECVGATKGNKACPTKRVNAVSLHEAIYQEIRRAAIAPTRMTEIIRDAVKTIKPAEQIDSELRVIQRSIRNKEREITNVVSAIAGSGKSGRALTTKLDELEAQKERLESDAAIIAKTAREDKVERPNPENVTAQWARFAELYRKGTDAQRNQLIPLIVEEVTLTEKERGTVKLIFTPDLTVSRSLVRQSVNIGSGGWT